MVAAQWLVWPDRFHESGNLWKVRTGKGTAKSRFQVQMLRLNSLLSSIIRHIRQEVPFAASTSVTFAQTYQLVVPLSRYQNGCGWPNTAAEVIQKGGRLNLVCEKMEGMRFERERLERLQEVDFFEWTTRNEIWSWRGRARKRHDERPLAAPTISWQHMLSLLQCCGKALAHSSDLKGRVSSCKSYSKRQSLAQRAGNRNGSTSYSEGR